MFEREFLMHVGSESEHKLAAVRGACEDLCLRARVVGFKTASRVNEQPSGLRETRRGAENRADGAWKETTDGDRRCDLALGIENGVVDLADDVRLDPVVDMAVVSVAASNRHGLNRRRFVVVSGGYQIEHGDVDEARIRGFDEHTVGSVTAERTGCDGSDATPFYTGGRVSRAELLRQAVKTALALWMADEERSRS
jgi:non-canonical (house-cleaning) NTP pyrophosphatase